jgi:hypothetical protein
MAFRNELDTDALYRQRDHTETLAQVELFSLTQLWDEYGIVGNLVVCIVKRVARSLLIHHVALYK